MEISGKKPRRNFTPEQKYQIIKEIEHGPTIRDGLAKHGITSGRFYSA